MLISNEKAIEALNLMLKENYDLVNKFMNIQVKLSGINPDDLEQEIYLSPINILNLSTEISELDKFKEELEYFCSVHGKEEYKTCSKCGDKTLRNLIKFK